MWAIRAILPCDSAGIVYAPSAGVRYFGVNSDDGFELWINGELVGQYANPRGPTTSDVNGTVNGTLTAGTMTYDFPAAGAYYLVLDFFENGGGEEIEFFQTDSTGGDQRLINVDSELVVYRSAIEKIAATNVTVVDENTLTCRADLTDATPGLWNAIVTPECGDAAKATLEDGLKIVAPQAGTVGWTVTPEGPMVLQGRKGGPLGPSEIEYTITNTGTAAIEWSAVKGAGADWIGFHTVTTGTLAAGTTTSRIHRPQRQCPDPRTRIVFVSGGLFDRVQCQRPVGLYAGDSVDPEPADRLRSQRNRRSAGLVPVCG